MSKQSEALKLALDALGPTPPSCCGCAAEWQIAIAAIKEALADKREWVGLTDAEVHGFNGQWGVGTSVILCVEAKLKEKNT